MSYISSLLFYTLRKVSRSTQRDSSEGKSFFRLPSFSKISSNKHTRAVLACASYSGCSVLLTLANKAIFSENRLNFPWMLLGVQSIVVALLLLIFYSTDKSRSVLKRDLLREMFLPCIFFTSFIFTNARALRYISLPILTVIKSLAPMGVALVERVLFKERVSKGAYMAMALILCGNAVTVIHDMEFHLVGYSWAALNIVMNVSYVISLRYCLSDRFSSGEKTLHSNVIACGLIFPLAWINGEIPDFFIEFGKTSLRFRSLFLLSCLLAAGIGASVFWVIATSSGSTLSFVGATNKILVVVLGAIFFGAKLSGPGWIGVGVGTFAGFLFAFEKAKVGESKRIDESLIKNLTVGTKFVDNVENEERIVTLDVDMDKWSKDAKEKS